MDRPPGGGRSQLATGAAALRRSWCTNKPKGFVMSADEIYAATTASFVRLLRDMGEDTWADDYEAEMAQLIEAVR
jgi:hypothetical protein